MFQGRLLEVEVGFNKAGFDGASEKHIWIYNFTGCIFWDDFDGDLLWWRRWDLWWLEREWWWPLLIEISLSIMILMLTFHYKNIRKLFILKINKNWFKFLKKNLSKKMKK